ncbi:hypothetical protein NEI02_09800 [Brachyspira pilosicoli]|uniref:Uncharacterized protein n=1 Tax=Brachyspira pilosicoli TaxID=52584 RepID=A0AAJ6G8L8_BRAPL|nr:hypothetical protein [Brachyspira pilosicoli]WIH89991.1 hypothetical protein NEI02_09800 [Brachyspira pilosicoli]WIH92286.1 hypothetical protein NEI01_09800 [Brachyspira pilosicoli]WIH94578.1 hypothetical protein NEH99_09795 [Brachyspira pilosicoli]
MKIKKILFNIYISLVIIFIISAIVLTVLGQKTRTGYFENLNINTIETIDLNNLNNKIQNEEELRNYINNNKLEYYSYNYGIGYEDKVFRHTDLYGIKFDTNTLPSYIELNIYNNNGTPYGTLISTQPLNDRVKVEYKLFIKPAIINVFSWVSIIFFIIYFFDKRQKIIDYIKSTAIYNLFEQKEHLITKKVFIISTILIALILFIFQFWLVYPGYFQYGDTIGTMGEAFDRNYQNWNPVIIAVFLSFLYDIFGYHIFYILFLNLFLWYSSITLIILSLYIKYNKKRVIFLFLISFLANIFFMNIIHIKDSTATLWVFLSYSLIFFVINSAKTKCIKILLSIFSVITLLIGMLWRLNFIVTVYPMFILYTYLLLGNNIKNKKTYFIKFVSIMIISAVLLVSIVKIFPTLFIKDTSFSKLASNHIFLWQIAGCTVPSNDSSMIPNEWYAEGKTFEDIKKIYKKDPLLADPFGIYWATEKPIKSEKLNNLKIVWIKSILKHPINFIIHNIRYSFYAILVPTWKIPNGNFQKLENYRKELYPYYVFISKGYINNFDNKGAIFSPIRDKIYTFIYNTSLDINIAFFVILSFILFIISIIFIYKNNNYLNNKIYIFYFSSSFSSLSTIIIVFLFTPAINYRYMYPIIPINFISLISLICFIIDIGGLNKFKEKLKHNK